MSREFWIGLLIGWNIGFFWMWYQQIRMLDRIENNVKEAFDEVLKNNGEDTK